MVWLSEHANDWLGGAVKCGYLKFYTVYTNNNNDKGCLMISVSYLINNERACQIILSVDNSYFSLYFLFHR
jgi:hypothetical protein